MRSGDETSTANKTTDSFAGGDPAPEARAACAPPKPLHSNLSEFSIRIKLSLIIMGVIVCTIAPFGLFTSRDLVKDATSDAIRQLQVENEMVRNMIAANQDGLRIALQRMGTAFRQHYQGAFSLDERQTMTIGDVRAPVLRLNGRPVDSDNRVVDEFTRQTGGSVATVFVRIENDFVRLSSSLKQADGTRAVGTFLGRDHPGYGRIIEGKSFQGMARLFGRQYMTEYIPIKDATNRIIGILFVGMDLTESIASLLDKARSVTFGKSGYVFIIDANKGEEYGRFILHPARQGEYITETEPGQLMLKQREGVLRYEWRNPELGETVERQKIAVFSEYRELGWLVGASRYEEEFLAVPNKGRDRMMLSTMALAALAILALNVAVGRWVVNPILRLQRDLARAERASRTVLDNMQLAVFLYSLDGRLLDVNAKMLEMYGLDRSAALQLTFGEDCWVHEGGKDALHAIWTRALAGSIEAFEALARRLVDGTTFPVEAVLCKCLIEKQECLLLNVRDISKRKRAEAHVLKLNRTLHVLSRCNETLVRSGDEAELLDNICRLLVDRGGYLLAWIGLSQPGMRQEPATVRGRDEGYLALLSELDADGEPSTLAMRENRVVRIDCIADGLPKLLWHTAALERGYRSIIAFPLKEGATTLGTLNIYAAQPDAFDTEEVALLTELAEDLAFGIVSLRNVAARRAAEQALHLRDRAIASSTEAILICSVGLPGAPVVYANDAVERITGFPVNEILGRNLAHLAGSAPLPAEIMDLGGVLRDDSARHTLVHWQRKSGSDYWGEISLSPVQDGQGRATHVIGIIKDVTETIVYQQQLERQVKYDALTGLPNRVLLADRLEHAIRTSRHRRQSVAVGFVDLDHFKYVNDSLGHSIGDDLLKAVATRLQHCLRDGDTVARLGGDEFVIILPEFQVDEWAIYVLQRMQAEIAKPFIVGDRELKVTSSIGVSLFPQDAHDAETLLRHADIAMYRAKDSGRNTIEFFTEEMNRRVQQRLGIEMGLRQAIEREEFFLHYQPQFRCSDRRVVGVEALLRWRSPTRGLVAPNEFIPVAEECGLILPIGEWVLRNACQQAAEWHRTGCACKVAVNVSARQFQLGNEICRLVAEVLADTGLPPMLLELEITESTLMHDPDALIAMLAELKDIGVKLALDDFGTGYSSFSYLKRFPVDMLKIDRSFVQDLGSSAEAEAIVTAIVRMAHALELETIAEGVETTTQFERLLATGCDQIQGYYLGRPAASEDVERQLRQSLGTGNDL